MRFIFRPLLNPGLDGRFILRAELQVRLRLGHDFIGIFADNALPDFTLGQVAGDDRSAAFMFTHGFFGEVEPELGFARFLIEAVTGETVLGEDGADIAVKG